MKLIKAKDYNHMSRMAARMIAAQITLKPDSVLGLATGSSTEQIYACLTQWYEKGALDFSGVSAAALDEYCGLSPENPQSYHYYMKTRFYNKINIKPENTHMPDGMNPDADKACLTYNLILSKLEIDMQLLGLGLNGHIGFNEPGESFSKGTHQVQLAKSTIEANSRFFSSMDEVPAKAYTMGIASIMKAKKIIMVVSGGKKADILAKTFFGPITPAVPASILQLHPDVTLLADQAALSLW